MSKKEEIPAIKAQMNSYEARKAAHLAELKAKFEAAGLSDDDIRAYNTAL
jgi:hypothetical protein